MSCREPGKLAMIAFVMVLAASVFGQEPSRQPDPALPDSMIGPPLIVWSQMQQPRPLSEVVRPDPPEHPPGKPANLQAWRPPAIKTLDGAVTPITPSFPMKRSGRE